MYKCIILPSAKEDIKEAANWYNDKQVGLGKRFTAKVRHTIKFIQLKPVATSIRYENVRTVLLDVFLFMKTKT